MADNYHDRNLLRIEDYEFQDGEGVRDKYLIVLNRSEDSAYVVHALTTSNPNGNNPSTAGCQSSKNMSYFYIPKDDVIGENGFFFEKHTFIFFSSNIIKQPLKYFAKYPDGKVDLKDVLSKKVMKSIIDCMLNSNFISFEQADALTKTRTKL